MSRKFFSAGVAVCLMAAPAFAVSLESFDTVGDWTVGGNDTTGTLTVEEDTTTRTEGAASLKLTYNYSGFQAYEKSITKTLTTPLDLSQARKFALQFHGESTGTNEVLWYWRFYSDNGYTWRYVNWAGLPGAGWTTAEFDPTQMEMDYWVSGAAGAYNDAPNIAKITKIQLILQQTSNVSGPGTVVLHVDDLQMENDSANVVETVLEDFEYADDAALDAVWTTGAPATFSIDSSTTTTKAEGSFAMALDIHIQNYWTNVTAMKTLPVVTDYSNVEYFKVWVRGDTRLTNQSPLLLFTLEDANKRQAWYQLRSAIKSGEWNCYWLWFKRDNNATGALEGPFRENNWDPNPDAGDLDATQVAKIGLALQGSTQNEVFDVQLVVDTITKGTLPVPTAAREWSLYE